VEIASWASLEKSGGVGVKIEEKTVKTDPPRGIYTLVKLLFRVSRAKPGVSG